jgi:hypothetical protein
MLLDAIGDIWENPLDRVSSDSALRKKIRHVPRPFPSRFPQGILEVLLMDRNKETA